MLPDLRVLVIATVSTFVLTVCAGLFAAVRLVPEPLVVHADRNRDELPFNRITVSWPDAARRATREPLVISAPAESPAPQTENIAPRENIAPKYASRPPAIEAPREALPAPATASEPETHPNVTVRPETPRENIAAKTASPALEAMTDSGPAATPPAEAVGEKAPSSGDVRKDSTNAPEGSAALTDPVQSGDTMTDAEPTPLPLSRPKVEPAPAEPRKARKPRAVRRQSESSWTQTPATDSTQSFFNNYGSSVR